MLSNAYFLAKFRFDTAENEPAKNLQNFRKMHFRKMHFRKMHFRKMHFSRFARRYAQRNVSGAFPAAPRELDEPRGGRAGAPGGATGAGSGSSSRRRRTFALGASRGPGRYKVRAKLGKLAKIFKFLAGSFSAVSKRNFARKYAFDSIFQALQDLHPFAPLQSQNFSKKSV